MHRSGGLGREELRSGGGRKGEALIWWWEREMLNIFLLSIILIISLIFIIVQCHIYAENVNPIKCLINMRKAWREDSCEGS